MPPGRVRLTSLVTLVNGEAMNLDTACKAMLGLLRRKGTEEAADMFTSSASKNTDYVLARRLPRPRRNRLRRTVLLTRYHAGTATP